MAKIVRVPKSFLYRVDNNNFLLNGGYLNEVRVFGLEKELDNENLRENPVYLVKTSDGESKLMLQNELVELLDGLSSESKGFNDPDKDIIFCARLISENLTNVLEQSVRFTDQSMFYTSGRIYVKVEYPKIYKGEEEITKYNDFGYERIDDIEGNKIAFGSEFSKVTYRYDEDTLSAIEEFEDGLQELKDELIEDEVSTSQYNAEVAAYLANDPRLSLPNYEWEWRGFKFKKFEGTSKDFQVYKVFDKEKESHFELRTIDLVYSI